MQRYSLELYRGLAERVDYPMNYHVTGSVRLAHSHERMMEFERVAGMGRYQGMDMKIMETHDLEGGLWDPLDGDMDPAQLTQALAKGARDLGANVIRFTPATGVSREGGECECRRVLCTACWRMVHPPWRARCPCGGDVPSILPHRRNPRAG